MQGFRAIYGAICRPRKPSGLVLINLNQRALLTPYVPIYIKKGDMDHTNFEVVNEDFSHNLPTIGSAIHQKGREYVPFGENNTFPQELVDYFNNSPIHSAIQQTKYNLLIGEGLYISNKESISLDEQDKAGGFLQKVNSYGETIDDLLNKIAKDYILFGGYCIEVIYTRDYTAIAELYHKDFSKIRSGQLSEKNEVKAYYYNYDWSNEHRYRTKKIPAFNSEKKQPKQLFYFKDYSPNSHFYPLPHYISSLSYIKLDKELADYNLNFIASGLSPSKMLNFNEGKPTSEEQKEQIYNRIMKDFTGSKGNKLFLSFNQSQDTAPTVTDIASGNVEQQLEALNNLILQNLITANQLPNPQLAGVKVGGELGSNTELMQSQELFQKKVVYPLQQSVVKGLNQVLGVNGYGVQLEIAGTSIISEKYSEDTLRAVLTRDELREKLGYEPLENENKQ